jgi:hypothetical protein
LADEEETVAWMIKQRSQVQTESLRLYELIRDLPGAENTELQFGTGLAFSLWRAVFLPTKGDVKDILKKGQKYLLHVIKTNNVTFQTDERDADWVFGYYLNNARLRFCDLARQEADFHKTLTDAGICDDVTSSSYTSSPSVTFENCIAALTLYIDYMKAKLPQK